jgi:hypothetical protein
MRLRDTIQQLPDHQQTVDGASSDKLASLAADCGRVARDLLIRLARLEKKLLPVDPVRIETSLFCPLWSLRDVEALALRLQQLLVKYQEISPAS